MQDTAPAKVIHTRRGLRSGGGQHALACKPLNQGSNTSTGSGASTAYHSFAEEERTQSLVRTHKHVRWSPVGLGHVLPISENRKPFTI